MHYVIDQINIKIKQFTANGRTLIYVFTSLHILEILKVQYNLVVRMK